MKFIRFIPLLFGLLSITESSVFSMDGWGWPNDSLNQDDLTAPWEQADLWDWNQDDAISDNPFRSEFLGNTSLEPLGEPKSNVESISTNDWAPADNPLPTEDDHTGVDASQNNQSSEILDSSWEIGMSVPMQQLTAPLQTCQQGKVRSYGCPFQGCNESFYKNGYLENHINTKHKGIHIFTCPVDECKLGFDKERELKNHMVDSHEGMKPFICTFANNDNGKKCGKGFDLRHNLKIHMQAHFKKKMFVCTVEGCAKSFAYTNSRNRHIEKDHPDASSRITRKRSRDEDSHGSQNEAVKCQKTDKERPFVCNWTMSGGGACGKGFIRKGHLKDHIKVVHEQNKPHICNYQMTDGHVCTQSFARGSILEEHIRAYHERAYKCDVCKITFFSKQGLRGHLGGKRHKEQVDAKMAYK